MHLTVKPANPADVFHVANELRDEDAREVTLATRRDPYTVVCESARMSNTVVVKVDGEPVALAGAAYTAEKSCGLVWMLCTPGVSRAPRRILKEARRWLETQHETYDVLCNRAWAGNALHLGWLRLLGFTLMPPVLVNGAEFIPFYRSKEDPFHV